MMTDEPIVDIRVVNTARQIKNDTGTIALETYAHRIQFRRANGQWKDVDILIEVDVEKAELES